MTDRHAGYLVVLSDDIREDDAKSVIAALQMIKGVASVQPMVADYRQVIARTRRDTEWADRINQVTREMTRS